MKILAVETSCDDTCLAVLEIKNAEWRILANVVSSQTKLHAEYGGVYPMLAKREHQKNLPIILKKTLKKIKGKIDLIAVTVGPGLEPCLWTGINFAKELAKNMKLAIVPVNHVEAHLLANKIKDFPAVCLIVSGGHSQLILMKNAGQYRVLGETRDDAAGECFDKAARILGLGYPGGPAIAAAAAGLKNKKLGIKLPRPMIYQKNYDFSFSGLKTAVLYDFKKRSPKIRKDRQYLREMAAEIQQAIIDVLIFKTLKAARNCRAKSIILAGGVAANQELRKQFALKIRNQKIKAELLVPPKNLCTDNAVMAAVAAYANRKKKTKNWQKIKANANLRI